MCPNEMYNLPPVAHPSHLPSPYMSTHDITVAVKKTTQNPVVLAS